MDYLNHFKIEDQLVHRLLEQRAAAAPDQIAFTFGTTAWSLDHWNRQANRMARNLRAHGITQGTRVAILMDTTPQYLALWMALAKLGAVTIPINTAYRGIVLEHVFKTCAASTCIVEARLLATVADASEQLTRFTQRFVVGSDATAPTGGAASSHGAPVLPFAALLAEQDECNLQVAQSHEDVTCVIFTSGTTGPSKGVMLSHRYLTAYGLMYARINALAADDVIMNFLPFFHIAAKFLTIAALACEGGMRLQPRLSISTFWEEVRAYRVTNFIGVGGICNMLVARPPSPDDAQTTIRTIYAVPDPHEIHEELERRFHCRITTVYGSTEVGLPLYRGVGDPYRPGSCGRVNPAYEVQIVDAHDNPLPPGSSGEIVVRPRHPYLIGSGYIGMPDRTVSAWRNLWLHSGDRGRMDADGFFYFEDRLNDSIRRRGENISSYEVETIVAKHPAVSEVAAVAAPAETGEDEVRIVVILREGQSASAIELLEHCARHMPYFMVPRYIDLATDVPRTATAKIEKYKIRAAGLAPATWDRQAHGWSVTRTGLQAPDGRVVIAFA